VKTAITATDGPSVWIVRALLFIGRWMSSCRAADVRYAD